MDKPQKEGRETSVGEEPRVGNVGESRGGKIIGVGALKGVGWKDGVRL